MDLTEQERAAIRHALLGWREEGVRDPRIPLDVDGDGVTDAFGLDEAGELIVIPGVAVADTVFRSDGAEGF